MASPLLSPTFHIGTIKIGSIDSASCFAIGNNFIEDFNSSKEHHQGLGNIHGNGNNFSHAAASLTNNEHENKKAEKPSSPSEKENPQTK